MIQEVKKVATGWLEVACRYTVYIGMGEEETTPRSVVQNRRAIAHGTVVMMPMSMVVIMARGTLQPGSGTSFSRVEY